MKTYSNVNERLHSQENINFNETKLTSIIIILLQVTAEAKTQLSYMHTLRTVIGNVRRKPKDQKQRLYDESASNSGRSILLQYYRLPILQELPYLTRPSH